MIMMHWRDYGWGIGYGWLLMVILGVLIILGIVYLIKLVKGGGQKEAISRKAAGYCQKEVC